jgi:hypothetical protein
MKLKGIKTVFVVCIWGGAILTLTINKELGTEVLKVVSLLTVALVLIS